MPVCFLYLVLVLMAGCEHHRSMSRIVESGHFIQSIHRSTFFAHIVLSNSQFNSNDHSILYVFLEGDGLPWKTHTQISSDPQPIYPLALDLMTKSQFPSIYLQRPCYGVKEAICDAQWWTNKRYSRQVVESMTQVLRKLSANYKQITLVGYSGGGTLAALIAPELNNVTTLITLAGNLDHKQWASYHRYSRLQGSLNPVDYVLPSTLKQFHYAAENDINILPQWIKGYSDTQKNSQFILLKNADHSCCWIKNWQRIVNRVQHSDINESN